MTDAPDYEPTDAEVTAYLEDAGIDMTEANKRLHAMIAKAKGDGMTTPDYGERHWTFGEPLMRGGGTTPLIVESPSGRHVLAFDVPLSREDGQLIVSCVNACRGIPDPERVITRLFESEDELDRLAREVAELDLDNPYLGLAVKQVQKSAKDILAVLHPTKREGE